MATPGPQQLASQVAAGDRRALAQAITLIESTRADHRADATTVIDSLIGRSGGSIRVGITGPPGVGKSTFIEAFGSRLTGLGHRVAVLAVDPSSSRGGGSILGDKTRMERLARDPAAFIRPSPAGTELGGVARRTREALLLCEAAGFDVVIVETVGVGQSELAVADLVDVFVLLASPSGGDDLQGIKRGIMELADLVVVTKADGDLRNAATHAAADLKRAIHLLRPKYEGLTTETLLVSSTAAEGIDEVWTAIQAAHAHLGETGQLEALRARQAKAWLWDEIRAGLLDRFRTGHAGTDLAEVERSVMAGEVSPTVAAQRLLGSGPPPATS